jgi:dihydropteroate synthase
MGVVNVTPDSFSDGGDFAKPAAAAAHARKLAKQGAHIIDIGGESTRPGSAPVSEKRELERVLPVFEALGPKFPALLSIDTSKAGVARACLESGAGMVNDVTAGRKDPKVLAAARDAGAYLALMHMQGEPRSMQEAPTYADVVEEVAQFLKERSAAALNAGVARERLLVDPGIGFGKTLEHNLQLLRATPDLRRLGFPLLVGASRKSLFKGLLGIEKAKARDRPTASLSAILAYLGADVLRVHEVRNNLEAARLGFALRQAGG